MKANKGRKGNTKLINRKAFIWVFVGSYVGFCLQKRCICGCFLFWVFLWPFCAALPTAAASFFVFAFLRPRLSIWTSAEGIFCFILSRNSIFIFYFFFLSRHRPQWCLCLHFNPQAKRLLVDRQKLGVSASPQRRNISGQRRVISWFPFYVFSSFFVSFYLFCDFSAPLSFHFALCFYSSNEAARWVFSDFSLSLSAFSSFCFFYFINRRSFLFFPFSVLFPFR